MLDVFVDTPTGNQRGPPSTSFPRAGRHHPSGVRLRSARYARLRSASPRRGDDGGKKDNLQKEFYTGAELVNGHIWIIARRLIPAGEEITFNYSYDLESYREHPCHCGSQNCAGYMVAEEFIEHVRSRLA